jgi:hypothetical protein
MRASQPLPRRPCVSARARSFGRALGTADVYETATAIGFSALELGYLARHLRRIDKHCASSPHSGPVSYTDC